MIEARTAGESQTQNVATPEVITTSMILEDLENGIDRKGIEAKYGLKTWEVTEMFKHPVLKGRKAKKKKTLSFTFVDDTEETLNADPAQMTVDQVIAEETTEHIMEEVAMPTPEYTVEATLDVVEEEAFIDIDEDEEEENDFNFEL